MKPATLNLKTLFSKDVRYFVPLFQRPYVWNQQDHWKPLWDDLTDVVDSYIRDKEETVPHFLGAVVLKQTSTPSAEIESRDIIDGQQRLITLQALIAACRAIAKENGFDKESRLFGQLNFNNEDVIEDLSEEHRLKIWPTNIDRDAFQSIMNNDDDIEKNITLITRCYIFFYKQICRWLKEAPEPETALKDLQHVLRFLFHIVVIDLAEKDNPQTIFETLNARGTPLSASDLIKNLIFQAATNKEEDVEFLYREYWQYFEMLNWRTKVRQGRFSRSRLDLFLSHYLVMHEEKAIGPSALFEAFRVFLKKWSGTIESLLQDLQKYARIYDRFDNYPDNDPRGIFFHRLRIMNVVATDPLLLYIFGLDNKGDQSSSLISILEMIESYLLRRVVMKLATERYTAIFIYLLQLVKQNPILPEANTEIRNYLSSLEGHYFEWPRDDEFRSRIKSDSLYKTLTQARVRMILEALERYLREDNKYAEQVTVLDKLTIEHLMPQKWETNWPLPDDDRHQIEKEQERNNRIHTLGNLTLINNRLNANLSNANWKTKRAAILDNSYMTLNSKLPEEWNEQSIDERGEYMAEIAIKIWSGPSQDSIEDSLDTDYEEDSIDTEYETVSESILTEEITMEDREKGRIRLSLESSVLLPQDKKKITIILRGVETIARWEPPIPPHDEGHMIIDRTIMGNLVEAEDILYLLRGDGQTWFID